MSDGEVLVVGAGVAGLAAAARLTTARRRVVLIEARDRIGGRVHTIRPTRTTRPIELGAEFVHGHANAIWPLIREAGLHPKPVAERHRLRSLGRTASLPDIRGALGDLFESHRTSPADEPVANLMAAGRARGIDADALDAVARYIEGFHGADLQKLGTVALAEAEGAEDEDGDDGFTIPEGYDSIPLWLKSRCTDRLLDLRLSTTLLALRWRPGEVTAEVRLENGTTGELCAPSAIVTLPLGVLKATANSGGVRIDPLPAGWHEALEALEMGYAHRIVLRFERTWWNHPGEEPLSFVHGPGQPFSVWWGSWSSDEPRLTGWTGGPRSVPYAGRSVAAMTDAALDSLTAVFGAEARFAANQIVDAHFHDWITDPLARGVYSYGRIGASAARKHLVEPVAGTLFLSGEAVAPEGRIATVHGAYLSGVQAAEKALGA